MYIQKTKSCLEIEGCMYEAIYNTLCKQSKQLSTIEHERLEEENFGKFGESQVRSLTSFTHQILTMSHDINCNLKCQMDLEVVLMYFAAFGQ